MTLILVLLALLLGVAVSSQGVANGALSQRVPLASAIFLNALVTLVGAAVWWTAAPGGSRRILPAESAPWWVFTGGFLGLFIISSAAFCFPRLGPGPTIALAVAAQLGAALAFDHFGVSGEPLPVTPMRLVGAGLLAVGALLVLWPRIAR